MTKMDKFRIGISAMVISSTVLAVGIPVIAYIANQPQKLNTKLESSFQNLIINDKNKFTFDDFNQYLQTNEKDVRIALANQLKTIPEKVTDLRLEENGNFVFYFQPKEDQNMDYVSSDDVSFEPATYNGKSIYVVTVRNLRFYEDAVTKNNLKAIWSKVNKVIIDNNITIATNEADATYEQSKDKIIDAISKTSLTGGKKIEKYWDKTINRNLNSISFKLSSELLAKDGFTKFNNFDLDEGYMTLDQDGTIRLNNLGFSSPAKYFTLNESKDTLMSLTEEGLKEPNLLIPYGVKKINDLNVFKGNDSVKNLILPDTLTQLPKDVFWLTRKLEYVKLPRRLTELPLNAFIRSSVKKVKWYKNLKTIGQDCFLNSELEGDIILPASLKALEKGLFQIEEDYENKKPLLTSVTTWAKNISENVFSGQTNLKRINLMSTNIDPLYDVDWNAFSGIPKTTKIYVKTEFIRKELINRCITSNVPEEQFTMISEDQIVVDENLDSILNK